jgi:DNA-binding transcriptional regulator GbsR (MarR family)
MDILDIKREFIGFMDEKYSGYLFPKSYFTVMMTLFIEQTPITQDKIIELSGVSRTIVSQMLNLLRINFPLRQIKKPKIRKRYFTIDLSVKDFILAFFTSIIQTYTSKVDFIIPIIEDVSQHNISHVRFRSFLKYLKDFHYFSSLYSLLLTDNIDKLSDLLKIGEFSGQFIDHKLVSSKETKQIMQLLIHPAGDVPYTLEERIEDEKLKEKYTEFKNRYYKEFRENFTLHGSQNSIARMIIGTELLLEKRPLTQKEIEETTQFHRSTISDILNLLIEMKMVTVIKKPGDRKKYYSMIQSWDARTITRFNLEIRNGLEMKKIIEDLIVETENASNSEEKYRMLDFFEELTYSYQKYVEFFQLLKMKYFEIRIKDYIDSNVKKSQSEP